MTEEVFWENGIKAQIKKIRKTRGAKIQESNGMAGLRERMVQIQVGERDKQESDHRWPCGT